MKPNIQVLGFILQPNYAAIRLSKIFHATTNQAKVKVGGSRLQ